MMRKAVRKEVSLSKEPSVRKGNFIEFKFLRFSKSAKTKVFAVITKEDPTLLGHIRWCANWRQYAFYDDSDLECVFEKTCLRDIANFCEDATSLHNWQKQKEKPIHA